MLCGNCDVEQVAELPRGKAYLIRCEKCCHHAAHGMWTVTENFVSYREGFKTDVCKGCGTVMREEQLLG